MHLVRRAIGNVAWIVICVSHSNNDTMYVYLHKLVMILSIIISNHISLAFYESLKKRREMWFMRHSSLSCGLNNYYIIRPKL
jgi:hypothetical protein